MWKSAHAQSVHIDVDYYDATHKELLLGYSTAEKIKEIVANGLNVPIPEFLTHFLFHRTRVAPSRYRSYATVRASIAHASGMLADFLVLENGALHLSDGTESLPAAETGRIGESIALSVMNAIHGMAEADWLPIPEERGRGANKSLDYQHASNGSHIIQVEAKGTVVDDVKRKVGSIPQHKANIDAKKRASRPVDGNTLRYGVISAISRAAQRPRAWLLDPAPTESERSPRELRVVARLRFLWWIISLVAPRSALAYALATRIRAVEALREPFELTNVPLGRPDGEPFTVQYADGYAAFFGTRSRVDGAQVGGVVVPVSRNALLFIGFSADLLQLAAKQDFEQIPKYSAIPKRKPGKVLCVVPAGEFRRFDIDEGQLPSFSRGSAYVDFELEGPLNYSQDGLVFGWLPIPE